MNFLANGFNSKMWLCATLLWLKKFSSLTLASGLDEAAGDIRATWQTAQKLVQQPQGRLRRRSLCAIL